MAEKQWAPPVRDGDGKPAGPYDMETSLGVLAQSRGGGVKSTGGATRDWTDDQFAEYAERFQ